MNHFLKISNGVEDINERLWFYLRLCDFIFHCVNMLHYKCLENVNLKRGGSYIDSSDWIKNKKPTINPINDDKKRFHYGGKVTVNHQENWKNSQIISKIKPFINKYNWKRANYPLGKDDWKMFEKTNPTVALDLQYVIYEYVSCQHFKPKLK